MPSRQNAQVVTEIEREAALHASIEAFEPVVPYKPIYLQSCPKSGTMLTRNIYLHFVGLERAHLPLLFELHEMPAEPNRWHFFYGHLPGVPGIFNRFARYHRVLIWRHPIDNVIALAKACFDPRTDREDYMEMQSKGMRVIDAIPLIAHGYAIANRRMEPFYKAYEEFYLDWVESASSIIEFNQMMDATRGGLSPGKAVQMLAAMGLPYTRAWSDRVRAGSSAELSSTFVANTSADQRQEQRAVARQELLKSLQSAPLHVAEEMARHLHD